MFSKVRDDMMSVHDAWDLKEQWFDLQFKYLLPVYEMKVNSVPYMGKPVAPVGATEMKVELRAPLEKPVALVGSHLQYLRYLKR